MPWSHGSYFTANETKEMDDFLKSQELNEAQRSAVSIWMRSQMGGQLALWSPVSMIIGVGIGYLFSTI